MSNSRYALATAFFFLFTAQHSVFAQIQTSSAEFTVTQPVLEDGASARSRYLVRTNPEIGGGVIGVVNQANEVVVSSYRPAGTSGIAGLDFQSQEGLLSFEELPEDQKIFDELILATPNRVAVGSLGGDQTVTIGGGSKVGISYSGQSPSTDLNATWGRGDEQVNFPVTRFGEVGYTPFNLVDDQAIRFEMATMKAVIEAGSATGTPTDSPANRVDPNNAMAQYPGVGSFEVKHPTLGTFICSGSVITNNQVLTAAHCFDQDNDGMVDAGITTNSKFYLNDGGSPSSTLDIDTIDFHPDFRGFAVEGGYDDMAIVTLDSMVPAGTTKFAIRNTGMATNEPIEMVGYGISGFGDVGGIEVLPDFHVKRSGENEADLFLLDDDGSGVDEVFLYDFDGPTGIGWTGGSTRGNDVETTVRGGDSGGPAFVDVDGVRAIAGIIGFEFTLGGLSPPPGEFGTLGGGPMINAAKWSWIETVAPEATLVPEPASSVIFTVLSIGILGWRKRRVDA